MTSMRCDFCCKELERHGERFIVTISRVPAQRGTDGVRFDLCAACAEFLRDTLDPTRSGKEL